jgi:hypothetical protein
MKKRKRMNQLAAQEERNMKQQQETGGVLEISDCDLGNSPQMSKGGVMSKYKSSGKMSPLGEVRSRKFQITKGGQQ